MSVLENRLSILLAEADFFLLLFTYIQVREDDGRFR